MVDFMKWALTDGQKFAAAPRLRAAAGAGGEARDGRAREDQGVVTSQKSDGRAGRWTGRRSCESRGQARWRSRIPGWDGAVRPRPDRDRRGDRLRAVAAVDADDREVRLRFLAHADLGSGRRRVRRVAVHLGHAVFVDSRAADRDADCARHRDLHRRAVPGALSEAAGVSDGAARGDSLDRLRPLGRFRAGAGGPLARAVDARGVAAVPPVQRSAVWRRHAGGRPDSRHHGDPVHVVGGARGAQVGAGRAARRRLRARAPRASRRFAPRSSTRAPASSAP